MTQAETPYNEGDATLEDVTELSSTETHRPSFGEPSP
jgi:hypothetical protein